MPTAAVTGLGVKPATVPGPTAVDELGVIADALDVALELLRPHCGSN